jgi:hypothetical protein
MMRSHKQVFASVMAGDYHRPIRSSDFLDIVSEMGLEQCERCKFYGNYGSDVNHYESAGGSYCVDCTVRVWAWIDGDMAFSCEAVLGDELACISYEVVEQGYGTAPVNVTDWGYEKPSDALEAFELTSAQLKEVKRLWGGSVQQDGYARGAAYNYRNPYYMHLGTLKALVRKGALVPTGDVDGTLQLDQRLSRAVEPRK